MYVVLNCQTYTYISVRSNTTKHLPYRTVKLTTLSVKLFLCASHDLLAVPLKYVQLCKFRFTRILDVLEPMLSCFNCTYIEVSLCMCLYRRFTGYYLFRLPNWTVCIVALSTYDGSLVWMVQCRSPLLIMLTLLNIRKQIYQ